MITNSAVRSKGKIMIIINVYAVIILNDGFPGNVASGQVDMYGLYAKSRTREASKTIFWKYWAAIAKNWCFFLPSPKCH